MPKFRVDWALQGSALIEADDADEAEQLLEEGLENLDSSMFDEIDIWGATVHSSKEM